MSGSVGLIVGSGFDALGLEIVARSPAKTPFGPPSSAVLTVRIGGHRLACIARHGEGRTIAPHAVNYRANVWVLHQHGVRLCIGLNTVGAIAPGLEPGALAVPDQLIDYTWGRAHTFHDGGRDPVRHVELTEPFDAVLRGRIAAAAHAGGARVHAGTYGVMQGPRLETAAEIDRLARDGCTMVGMTAMPEAALARELGIDFAICAVAVNYAAGRSAEGTAIHAQLELHLGRGMARAKALLERLVPELCRASRGQGAV